MSVDKAKIGTGTCRYKFIQEKKIEFWETANSQNYTCPIAG